MQRLLEHIRQAAQPYAHTLHRSEQYAHCILYGALFAGFKEVYVLMGGVVAALVFVAIVAATGDGP